MALKAELNRWSGYFGPKLFKTLKAFPHFYHHGLVFIEPGQKTKHVLLLEWPKKAAPRCAQEHTDTLLHEWWNPEVAIQMVDGRFNRWRGLLQRESLAQTNYLLRPNFPPVAAVTSCAYFDGSIASGLDHHGTTAMGPSDLDQWKMTFVHRASIDIPI